MITNFNIFESTRTIREFQVLCIRSTFPSPEECVYHFTQGKIYNASEWTDGISKHMTIIDDNNTKKPLIGRPDINNEYFVKSSPTGNEARPTKMYYAFFTEDKNWKDYQKRLREEQFDL